MTRRQATKKPAAGVSGVQLGEATARAMILQGAARVFAQQGVRAASVEDILKAAKVSRRTFYRFYESKEDVLVALYRTGTEGLLDACRFAVREEADPLRKLERCIDAHLLNARGLGRLIYVLGGEAQHSESALHARRMELHEELSTLLAGGSLSLTLSQREREQEEEQGREAPVDPWVFRGLILALEGLTRLALEQGDEGRDVPDAALTRVKRVVMRMAEAALADRRPERQ